MWQATTAEVHLRSGVKWPGCEAPRGQPAALTVAVAQAAQQRDYGLEAASDRRMVGRLGHRCYRVSHGACACPLNHKRQMRDRVSLRSFGDTARSLSRNPLGIIALFLVLVYALAAQVTTFGGSFAPDERLPLIYFLVIFPFIVLFVFAWLVSGYSSHLYSPSDFKDEENYVKMMLATAKQPQHSINPAAELPAAAKQAQAASQQQDSDQVRLAGFAAQPNPGRDATDPRDPR